MKSFFIFLKLLYPLPLDFAAACSKTRHTNRGYAGFAAVEIGALGHLHFALVALERVCRRRVRLEAMTAFARRRFGSMVVVVVTVVATARTKFFGDALVDIFASHYLWPWENEFMRMSYESEQILKHH
jgi:hypothetical protein